VTFQNLKFDRNILMFGDVVKNVNFLELYPKAYCIESNSYF